MCSSSSAGGSVPWPRHTTIGTAQISHSAIQQTSSSWNHSVIRAASQRSQSASNAYASRHAVGAPRPALGGARTRTRAASSGPPPSEEPADERAPDDRRRRRAAAASTACSGVEMPTPSSTGRSVAALQRRAHLVRLARELRPLPGDAHQRHAVDEAAGALADRAQPVVGGRRRGEQHRLDAGGVGGVAPAVELVERAGRGRSRRRCPASASDAAKRSWPAWWTGL